MRDSRGRFIKGAVHSPEFIAKCVKARTKYTAEELKEHQKQWVKDNIDRVYAKQKEWRDKNKDKVKQYDKKSKQKHNARVNATNAQYRAEKLQRTPSWLSENDFNKIKKMYDIAKKRSEIEGIKYHVDHIIPLKGKIVSGLHVPSNLQVITWRENITKNNTFNGE
jgi:organic radical activating enzyme